ncbi:MAG: hydroxyacylglutathione hydrolase [Gammaproteobacteria bacterium]
MVDVFPVAALKDNYIWFIRNGDIVVVVDPSDAVPVDQTLAAQGLKLTAILVTHHHWDHVNGIESLVERYRVPVYGPKLETIPQCRHGVIDGDTIEFPDLDLSFKVLGVPGHTSGAVAYFGAESLFSGDTLFTAGCGRLFEGTAEQMYTSLTKLMSLPPQTRLYCGHEYTRANLAFARAVEPDNGAIAARIRETAARRAQGLPTVPSTLELERQTNPFVRCSAPEVKRAAERQARRPLCSDTEIFAALRQWKDIY